MDRFDFVVHADSFEEAIAKLIAEHNGDDCPCGLPQWGLYTAIETLREYGTMDGYLCMCLGPRSGYFNDVENELRRQQIWEEAHRG
jgi:hypothetical protein